MRFVLFFVTISTLFLFGHQKLTSDSSKSIFINPTVKTYRDFHPYPYLSSPHLQSIFGYYFASVDNPESTTHLVHLEDGDQIALEISTPENWTPRSPTVLMVHGLGGSHESTYLKRLAQLTLEKGARAIRMNLRGCGTGKGFAKKGYHGGLSQDLKEVIVKLYEAHPLSPLSLVGFSLSGNTTLKLLGEDPHIHHYLERAVAVCPAISLEESSLRFKSFPNTMYQRSFLKTLVQTVKEQENEFPDGLLTSLQKCRSLYEFDELFTAPFWGFSDAKDYYTKSSSCHLIPNIKLNTHILFAADDPLIHFSHLDLQAIPSHVEVVITKHGGHMGFVGHPKKGPVRWMDHQIIHWLELH